MDDFFDELVQAQLITYSSDALDYLVDEYNDGLKCLLDKHAPLKTKTFVLCTTVQWYNHAIQQAKRDARRLERFWSRIGVVVHQQIYKEARNRVIEINEYAKREYYNDKVINAPFWK